MPGCSEQIISQEYADYIVEYGGNEQDIYDTYPTECVQIFNARYAAVHIPVESMNGAAGVLGYHAIPKLFGLMDTSSMDASGITRIQNQQFLNLNGDGVIVGIVDTGIDYTNSLFRRSDGMTRIIGIWDQSYVDTQTEAEIRGEADRFKPDVAYGRAYSTAQINQALTEDDPMRALPLEDVDSHGTFLAGIAAGGRDYSNDFVGAAPRADIAVVKLKPAKRYLREYYLIQEDALAFQENDIMAAVDYLLDLSAYYRKPIAICIGMGTASGSHTGTSFLCRYLDYVGSLPGVAISVAAGNESNRGSHYFGRIAKENSYIEVELRAGEERGFVTELWGVSPDLFRVGFVSPSGQVIEPIQGVIGQRATIDFIVEPTQIFLYYQITDFASGSQVIFIRFKDPAPGVWRIRVYGAKIIYGDFHMWLPIAQFRSEETFFLDPQPDSTVTSPGDCKVALCAGAYNHYNNSLYIYSGRGFAPDGAIYPSLCAPGVDVFGPINRGRFGSRSGTSIAAAHGCGACALILQWAYYKQQMIFLTSEDVKQYLIRGARREDGQIYPNRFWGYGILDVYHSFEIFLT